MTGPVRINGVVSDGLVPVSDSSVLRGDGCFEVVRSYQGKPFALEQHLDRLDRSAAKMGIRLPDRGEMRDWILSSALEGGDCAVRVVATRGSALPGAQGAPMIIVFSHLWPQSEGRLRLMTVEAPWHAAGREWALAGAKILSYAPNVSASRQAAEAGFDEALMTAVDGSILEGPTFSVAWVVGGVLETPTLHLGILDSITRSIVLDLAKDRGVPIVVDRFDIGRLDEASEVMVISTMRQVQSVSEVDHRSFAEGPVTTALAATFDQLVGSASS